MIIVVCVALVCSALVTTAVQILHPIQAAYAAIERNRAIVVAAGLVSSEADDAEVVAAFLTLDARVMARDSGKWVEEIDGRTYDHWKVDADQPGRYLPVYLVVNDGQIDRVVVPVDGKGMWSTLYGFLALKSDLNTISSLVIYEHGETPGIGDRIQDPQWLAQWQGKRLRDAGGALKIDVSPDTVLPEIHRIDTITGATVTARAVGRMVQDRIQEYDAILQQLSLTAAGGQSR
ncbi:MAG: NADH:ubiquinone reductase (Na(+)-transporting) subunit C [Pseudomonadales bacterium]|nr:NADH:ubiquinone reductase (Na(+)-transporting) subunit C [Pseudomonadales bacterium]